MTQFWREDGEVVPVTVIQGGPCVITQIKTAEKDGYTAVQLGFKDKKESRATQPEVGHFKKAGTSPKYFVREFRGRSFYPALQLFFLFREFRALGVEIHKSLE